MKNRFYVSTFCNQAHDRVSGKPLNHECHILHPEDLTAETNGEFRQMRKLGVHKGIRAAFPQTGLWIKKGKS